jgi:hypothetical protein
MKVFMTAFFVGAVVTAMLLALAGCENGDYFDPNTKQFKGDAAGRLEAVGTDLRVYEFTPQTNTKKQCVFVAGENKGAMSCWDK